jgi:hypothetical protein
MGRIDEARQAWHDAGSAAPEPQMYSWWASMPAALGWADDPEGSVTSLESGIKNILETDENPYHTTLSLLGRMALRIGRDESLRVAADALRILARDANDSPVGIHARHCEALLDADRARAALTVAGIAAEFEAVEHRLAAADAYADAAWLAERGGSPNDDFARRAASLYTACSAVPLLEPLPIAASGA